MHAWELHCMQYNNRNFGLISEALIISPYIEKFPESKPSPPVGHFHLLDDSGLELVDDSGDYLVTP